MGLGYIAPDSCPACGEYSGWRLVGSGKTGVSAGKAVVGTLIAGIPGAIIGGAMGKDSYTYYCIKCGCTREYKHSNLRGDEEFDPDDIKKHEAAFENHDSKMLSNEIPPVVVTSENEKSVSKRVELFLEDEEWEKADAYAEQLLNYNAENSMAYVYKLMAELRVSTPEELTQLDESFEYSSNFKKACRFSPKIKKELDKCINIISDRNSEREYQKLLEMANSATSSSEFEMIADSFGKLDGNEKAKRQQLKYLKLANQSKLQEIYLEAQECMEKGTLKSLNKAKEKYLSIAGWKDSDDKTEKCAREIEIIENEKSQRSGKLLSYFIPACAVVLAALMMVFAISMYKKTATDFIKKSVIMAVDEVLDDCLKDIPSYAEVYFETPVEMKDRKVMGYSELSFGIDGDYSCSGTAKYTLHQKMTINNDGDLHIFNKPNDHYTDNIFIDFKASGNLYKDGIVESTINTSAE